MNISACKEDSIAFFVIFIAKWKESCTLDRF